MRACVRACVLTCVLTCSRACISILSSLPCMHVCVCMHVSVHDACGSTCVSTVYGVCVRCASCVRAYMRACISQCNCIHVCIRACVCAFSRSRRACVGDHVILEPRIASSTCYVCKLGPSRRWQWGYGKLCVVFPSPMVRLLRSDAVEQPATPQSVTCMQGSGNEARKKDAPTRKCFGLCWQRDNGRAVESLGDNEQTVLWGVHQKQTNWTADILLNLLQKDVGRKRSWLMSRGFLKNGWKIKMA